MRIGFACLFLLSAFVLPVDGLAQNATSPVTQALQASLQAMIGSSNVQDVTLNGTAEAIAGSDDETGSFVFRATATGSSRVDLGLTSGTRSETRQPGNGSPSGSWSNALGGPFPLAQHNLLTGYDWAFPAFIETQMLTNSAIIVTFVGQEGALLHLTATQQPPSGLSAAAGATAQHLTQFDLWLSTSTFLPAQLTFNIHPDNNAGMDIPVEVQFSNYQNLGGIMIPGHIQKFVNNTLALDAQIQTAVINSGLSASTFTIQ